MERTGAYSDRTDRLNPNIVFSKRYSYQRRGHLTVSEVESWWLTLPRTRTGWSLSTRCSTISVKRVTSPPPTRHSASTSLYCAVLALASASAAVSLSRVSIVAGARGNHGIGRGNALSTRDNTVDNERNRNRLIENSRPQMI